MTHPALYAITIGVAIGAAIYTFFAARNLYNYEESPRRRGPFTNYNPYDSFEVWGEGNNQCTICLDDISNNQRCPLRCGHSFHQRCLNKWLEQSVLCPNCRSKAVKI